MMEDHLIEKNNGLNGMSADDGGSSDLDDGGSFDLDENEDKGSVGSDAFITPLAQYKPHDDHLGLRRRRRTNLSYSGDDHQHLTRLEHLRSLKHLSLPTSLKIFKIVSSVHHLTKQLTPLTKPYGDHILHLQLLKKPYDEHMLHLQLTPLTKRPSAKFDFISKFLTYVSLGGPMIDQIFQSILKKPVALLLNKPFDDHFGLRQRRIKLSSRGGTLDFISWFRDDDYLLHRLIDLVKGLDVVSKTIYPRRTAIAAAGTEQRITPSRLLLMNTPHRIDMQEGSSNDEELHGKRKGWSQKMDFEWIFVITNIMLESMSAIFTQLSSKQKPQYALFGMLLSYLALLTCIIELIYEGCRHQQIPIWRRRRGTWSYYRPQRRKSFATLNNIVALACALGQCVVTTINYRFESLIKLTVSPIILANGVLFSKILKYRQGEAL